jgi:HEPN domain-containing protein
MDDAKFAETRQWLIKSQRDLKAAYVLIKNEESLLDAVVYHCQQAAEKALKAYLTYQERATSVLEFVIQKLPSEFESEFGNK